MTRVLVVGSAATSVATLREALQADGAEVERVHDAAAALEALARADYDCVVVGDRPGVEPDRLERHLRDHGHGLPVVRLDEHAPPAAAARAVDRAETNRLATTRDRRRLARSLVADVAAALRECSDAPSVERTACECLANSRLYRAAWIGRWDDERGVVVPAAATGLEVGSLAEVGGDPEGTVAARVPVEWTPIVGTDGRQATVAVPVRDEAPVGVLQVYADRPDGVDAPERDRLVEIGSVVGSALGRVDATTGATADEGLDVLGDTLAHELGNQLDAARVQLELARDREGGDHLERVEEALERIADVAADAKALARGSVEAEPRRLSTAAEEAWAAVETRDATLSVEAGAVEADEDLLGLLLENLFRNAVEHGSRDARRAGGDAGDGDPGVATESAAGDGADGRPAATGRTARDGADRDGVTVRVGPLQDGFHVEDDGPGIPPEDRDDVFDWGYTTRSGSGAGLGIVSLVAERHGWTTELLEGEAGGARFEFRR